MNFPRTDTVLGVDDHPHRAKPLVQTNGRILKDRALLDGELLLTGFASPHAARANE